MKLRDRAPQSSEFYADPQKREDYSLIPVPNPEWNATMMSVDDQSSIKTMKSRAEKESQKPVEIEEIFRGPLITRDGHLYNDEAHDQTYKKRLRLREVELIYKYLQEYQEARGDMIMEESNPEQSMISLTPRTSIQYDEVDKLLVKLKFFARYPYETRRKLIQGCGASQLQIYETGDIIFRQGDDSAQFYVMLRGSAKAILIKKEYGFIPFVVNTFYDGKEFGEVTLYQVSDRLTPEQVQELNRQKYTCEAMERTFVLALDKEHTVELMNRGLRSSALFEDRISFLSKIDLFEGIDLHVLLPLANNLEVRKFKLGEYILREGQEPKGLFIVTRGQLRVGSEQINTRSKDLFPLGRLRRKLRNFKFRGNFHDMEDKIATVFRDNAFAEHEEE